MAGAHTLFGDTHAQFFPQVHVFFFAHWHDLPHLHFTLAHWQASPQAQAALQVHLACVLIVHVLAQAVGHPLHAEAEQEALPHLAEHAVIDVTGQIFLPGHGQQTPAGQLVLPAVSAQQLSATCW